MLIWKWTPHFPLLLLIIYRNVVKMFDIQNFIIFPLSIWAQNFLIFGMSLFSSRYIPFILRSFFTSSSFSLFKELFLDKIGNFLQELLFLWTYSFTFESTIGFFMPYIQISTFSMSDSHIPNFESPTTIKTCKLKLRQRTEKFLFRRFLQLKIHR